VDITFGEYLRGLITADSDLIDDDRYNYRVAFVEAFRRRGIYPQDLETLSVDTLRWQGTDLATMADKHLELKRGLKRITRQLKRYADACTYISDRNELFIVTRRQRKQLHNTLKEVFAALPAEVRAAFGQRLGLDPATDTFEVHELRRSIRVSPDGKHLPQIILALTQDAELKVADSTQTFRGGSTLLIDLANSTVKYAIRKRVNSCTRRARTEKFLKNALADPLRSLLLGTAQREPFAALHALADLAN
jgi:hypothetical protein